MVEATFIASGKTSLEALEMAASVASEVLLGSSNFIKSKKLDIFCDNIDDANKLNEILWIKPKYSIYLIKTSLLYSSSKVNIPYQN